MNGAGTPRPHVVGQDRHDGPSGLAGDQMPSNGARTVEAAVEHDPDHGVPAIRRQIFGPRDEVAGGVVDENVHAAKPRHGGVHHGVHLLRHTHIHLRCGHGVACRRQRRRSAREILRIAAGNHQVRAHLSKSAGDRQANPRAAAGDDGGLSFQYTCRKHGLRV